MQYKHKHTTQSYGCSVQRQTGLLHAMLFSCFKLTLYSNFPHTYVCIASRILPPLFLAWPWMTFSILNINECDFIGISPLHLVWKIIQKGSIPVNGEISTLIYFCAIHWSRVVCQLAAETLNGMRPQWGHVNALPQ